MTLKNLAKGTREWTPISEVTVDTNATEIIPRRKGRVGALIQNKDASEDLFIGPDSSITGASDGFRIEANKSFFLDSQAPVFGIVASGSISVDGLEYHNE